MRINVPVRLDTDAEYELTGEEIAAALVDLSREHPNGWPHAAHLITVALTVLRNVPDEIVNGIKDAPRSIIHKELTAQLARYEPRAAPVGQNEDQVTHQQLLAALVTLNRLHNLGDAVYDVRERADLSNFAGSSWQHPDVVAYGEASAVVMRAIRQYKPGTVLSEDA